MKFIRKEVSRTLLTHWRYNLLLFFVLSACILMAYIVLYNTRILSEQSREFDSEISGKRYFQISLTSSGYETIFNSEKMYSQIGVIEQRIHESPLWDDFFFFLSNFGLAYSEDGEKILPEIFEDGFEFGELNDLNSNFQVLKVMELSPNAFPSFGIDVCEGRLFQDQDLCLYEEKGDYSSVILGAAYRDYYNIGDIIQGEMYSEDSKLEVVGFLEEGAMFISPYNLGLTSLDRYIIYPTHTQRIMLDGSIENDPMQFYGALVCVGGMLSVSDPSVNVQQEMNTITSINGFPAIQCTPWGAPYLRAIQNISERNVFLFAALSIVLCSLSIVSITRVLMKKTEMNMPSYATYMMSGICPRSIIIAVALESSIIALLAVVPPIWISYLQFHVMTVPIYALLIISILITAISLFPTLKLIASVNLDLIARRKSE